MKMNPVMADYYDWVSSLTGSSPLAIRERYIASDSIDAIGYYYYLKWVQTGEIDLEVLEECMEAKKHYDRANHYEEEFRNCKKWEVSQMALFDKLSQAAKNIGDKTNDAIETTRLNSKISAERSAAAEEMKKIGEHYYNLFAASGEAAPEVLEFCQSAKAHYDAAAEAQAEIDRIKAENEAEKAAPAPAAAPAGITCPSCGAANAPGTKFCQSCGAKLEAPAPQERKCPACGANVEPGVKFCGECGQRMEE